MPVPLLGRRRVTALFVVPLLLVATACGGSDSSSEGSAEADQTPATTLPTETGGGTAATGELAGVTVTGAADAEPKLAIDDPFSVEETTTQVLTEGDGPPIREGNQVTVAYVLANGASGKVLDSSYDRGEPLVFQMQPDGILPGLYSGLLGQPAGSRLAVAVPPEAGFGPQGNPQFGVQPNETLVFVLDVEDVTDVAEMAEGERRAAPDDLPALEVDDEGVPQGFKAEGDEPGNVKELVAAPVIVGDGPKVQPGDTLTVQYLGQLYPDGAIFDQSWTGGQPFGFQVGTGAVIPGWDQGLTGQRVGSRVILAIPSDLAYGPQGQPPDIPADADLIFSVDILAAG